MRPSSSGSRGKGHAKVCRKTRKELDRGAHDHRRRKRRRGHTPGSRAAGGSTTSGSRGQNAPKDPRIGSKTPIPLDVTEKVTRQHEPKSKKPTLSPQAGLELLETDGRLDALLGHLEIGETPSAEEQSWVDAKLDRINELMQKLGLSYDGDEGEGEDEKQEDMTCLLRGN